jgi:GH35 family endo-1,4-beta-xylanase
VSPKQVQSTPVIAASGIESFAPTGAIAKLAVSTVKVEGQSFDKALRVELKEKVPEPWAAQIRAETTAPVTQGDVLLATFYARTLKTLSESAEGMTEFVLEKNGDPWTKSVIYPVRAGKDWIKFQVPFAVTESYAPGQAQVMFRLGFALQVMEIGGISLENYGRNVRIEELPRTRITYRGREADAGWRAAAESRINQVRKDSLRVNVRDAAGKALAGAEVSIALEKHAFLFGTAVDGRLLTENPEADKKKYQQALVELFNCATLENDLKWPPLAGEWGKSWNFETASRAVDWLNARGLAVRGHVLVWPSWRNSPKSLEALKDKPNKLRAEIKKHVRELAGSLKGKISHWDVVNEPFDNHDITDILGNNELVTWFKDARAADPKALLFINDYGILSSGAGNTPHRDHYEKTIQFLIDKKAPLDGIGMQGHFGAAPTAPEDALHILDRFGKFNKPIVITEYDVDTEDRELAADYTRDILTVLFSHPAVQGFVMWGFWDGAHWKKNAPLLAHDFSLKPSGRRYKELVFERWTTRQTGKTGGDGSFATRGFLGDYQIIVKHGDKQKKLTARLARGGASVDVKL